MAWNIFNPLTLFNTLISRTPDNTADQPTAITAQNTGTQVAARGVAIDLVVPGDGSGGSGSRVGARIDSRSAGASTQGGELVLSTRNSAGSLASRMVFDSAGRVGIGVLTPGSIAPSAFFELSGTSTGFLPPRLTTTQRDNISSPATGLMVYNTITNTIDFYNGSSWRALFVIPLSVAQGGTGTSTAFTAGSMIFAGASGVYTQDNSNFFWDNSNKALGIGTATPAATSVLDLTSTAKGFLPPRMTTTQRNAITSPATGLVIYNTSTNVLNNFNGTSWVETGSGTSTVAVAFIKDVKTSGTAGGTATAGSYQTRTLNTLEDPSGIVTSLSSNQFTLPAGTYVIEASAPAQYVTAHKIKVRNITDSTDQIIGSSERAENSGPVVTTRSNAFGRFTIAASKTFEIQHRVQNTKSTDGFGNPSSFSDSEIYTIVKITRFS